MCVLLFDETRYWFILLCLQRHTREMIITEKDNR